MRIVPVSIVAASGLVALSFAAAAQPDSIQPPPTTASAAEHMMNELVQVPFGEIAEDCVTDKYDLYFIVNFSRFGAPEDRKDTIIQYDRARGTIHVAMYGGAKTTDDAKKRLETRKKALDYAVKSCSSELGKPTKAFYSYFEMTYTRVDREAGKQYPLVRWHRGRWELL